MTALKRVTVGSRSSPLSLAQTEEVVGPLKAVHPDIDFILIPIKTLGDKKKNAPLLSMPKGMFVKEIEQALLDGEIDFAVHSAKDLTAILPESLEIGAFAERRDPRDVLVNRWGLSMMKLPAGARIGTSSPRRTAQLKVLRPDIEVLPIRGNVGTRLEKARSKSYDGIVVAAAGLARLGKEGEVSEYLSPDVFTPEVGQGALAVEALAANAQVLNLLAEVDHRPTRVTVTAERAFLMAVGGGCKVPVAAYAQLQGSILLISTVAALPDGSRIFRAQVSCNARDPEAAGREAAEALMATGAAAIIARGPIQ